MIETISSRVPQRNRIGIRDAVFTGLLLCVALIYPVTTVDSRLSQKFVFDRFNKSYHDLNPRMAPVRRGPLTIQISSPRHVVTLRKHSLEIGPDGKGTHSLRLNLEFEGEGDLVADLDLAGLKNRIEDEVLIPLQKKSVDGRIRLARGERGYLITPLSLPKYVELEIQSRLAHRLVSWCGQVTFNVMDCTGFDRMLSKISLPVPQEEAYFIADADLTASERKQIEAYIRASGGNSR